MIQIDDAIVSMDCLSEKILLRPGSLQGACCGGRRGAPLELDEVAAIEMPSRPCGPCCRPGAGRHRPARGWLTPTRRATQTSIVNKKTACSRATTSAAGCYCALEKAYREGKTHFYKPSLVPSLSHPAQENRWRGGAELPPVGRVPHGRGEGRQLDLPVYRFPEGAAGAAFWQSLVCRTGERRGGTEGARLSAGLNKKRGESHLFSPKCLAFFGGLIYFLSQEQCS